MMDLHNRAPRLRTPAVLFALSLLSLADGIPHGFCVLVEHPPTPALLCFACVLFSVELVVAGASVVVSANAASYVASQSGLGVGPKVRVCVRCSFVMTLSLWTNLELSLQRLLGPVVRVREDCLQHLAVSDGPILGLLGPLHLPLLYALLLELVGTERKRRGIIS